MGFGSYDESEQENQELDISEEDEGEKKSESKHDGEVNFEMGEDTDSLIESLSDM